MGGALIACSVDNVTSNFKTFGSSEKGFSTSSETGCKNVHKTGESGERVHARAMWKVAVDLW